MKEGVVKLALYVSGSEFPICIDGLCRSHVDDWGGEGRQNNAFETLTGGAQRLKCSQTFRPKNGSH